MKIRLLSISFFGALLVAGCGKNEPASSSATPSSAAPSSSATAAASNAPTSPTSPAATASGTAGTSGTSGASGATATSGKASAPAAAKSGEARTIEITANDQMKFSVTTIEAKPGEQLKIVLKNIGNLPKDAMGHNWVLLKKGSDPMAFANAAVAAKRRNTCLRR